MHRLRKRPEGRIQCLDCRAAFQTLESARLSVVPCQGFHLPHGHPYDREHIVYPTWYDQGNGHGPDRVCDEISCFCINHKCDCDVCQGVIRVPALKVLVDSRENRSEKRETMSHEIETHMPAALRKHAVRSLECTTPGQFDLMNACKALNLGKSNISTTVALTNDALGAALAVCREWLTSDNNNNVMAAKTVLKRHEMDYVPSDPRERRHEVKLAASIAKGLLQNLALRGRPEIEAELRPYSSDTGLSGRVSYEALGWLLEVCKSYSIHGSGAAQRAGKKFVQTYLPAWEETGHLISEHLKSEDQDEPVTVEQPQARNWERTRMASLVSWSDHPTYFYYGGSAKEEADPVGTLVSLTWSESKNGRNLLKDVDTGEVVAEAHSMAYVWSAKVESPEPIGEDQGEGQAPAEDRRDWRNGRLGDVPRLRDGARILFGGKAGKSLIAPTEETPVGITYTGEGKYELWSLETEEVVNTFTLQSQLWWTPLPEVEKAPAFGLAAVEVEDQEPEEVPEPQAIPRGSVPENWVYMSENADTDTARAWWAKKVRTWNQ